MWASRSRADSACMNRLLVSGHFRTIIELDYIMPLALSCKDFLFEHDDADDTTSKVLLRASITDKKDQVA